MASPTFSKLDPITYANTINSVFFNHFESKRFSLSILMACSLISGCNVSDSQGNSKEKVNNESRLLHVPSPEWQDQIIYFSMIDRFNDGDPDNNDFGYNLYDPTRESHYSGGDLKGLTEKVDYIKALGATSVWITPHIANLWWDPINQFSGYHGYWARNFKQVDEHYGSLEDLKDFSHTLHSNGMYLIQDVVVNHVGTYFYYDGEYDPDNPHKNFKLNEKAIPATEPTQSPFDFVNLNDPKAKDANIYHWTPEIQNFEDKTQETTYQTSMLNDLNTSNPKVRDALKNSFGYWISEVGVDGFRIDTVKYVEPEFYTDFIHGGNGINKIAKESGRDNFLSFGEIFMTSKPFQTNGEEKLNEYVTNDSKTSGPQTSGLQTSTKPFKALDSAIGFPLYHTVNQVFAASAPTSQLGFRLNAHMQMYPNPFLTTNFIDNHDVERFLAGGSLDGFKQAYGFMMTIPGIPMIYQGDEQAFVESRKAMFKGGYQNTTGSFDTDSEMFQYISNLAQIRKSEKLLTRGDVSIHESSSVGAGIFVYSRHWSDRYPLTKELMGSESEDEKIFVIINSAQNRVLLNQFDLGDFEYDSTLFSHNYLANTSRNIKKSDMNQAVDHEYFLNSIRQVDSNQYMTLELPPQSFLMFKGSSFDLNSNQKDSTENEMSVGTDSIGKEAIVVNAYPITFKNGATNKTVSNKVTGYISNFNPDNDKKWKKKKFDWSPKLQLVIDGNLDRAKPVEVSEKGQWTAHLPISDLGDKEHQFELYWPEKGIVSSKQSYRVINQVPKHLVEKTNLKNTCCNKDIKNSMGTDENAGTHYQLPLHDTFGCEMNLNSVQLKASGSVAELTLNMCNVSQQWMPSNGFDHVAFSIFITLDENSVPSGVNEKSHTLPLINSELTRGWHLAHTAYGWGNTMYGSKGANAVQEGNKIGVAPSISIDLENNKIQFRYEGLEVMDWSGSQWLITTWDKDGNGVYRPIEEQATMWAFGTGEGLSKGKRKDKHKGERKEEQREPKSNAVSELPKIYDQLELEIPGGN